MQDTPELRERLKQMVVERLSLPMDPSELADSDHLMNDHGVDSVGLFWILVGLDEEFGVQVGEDEFDLETFSRVESIAQFLASRPE
jgi:acyl carrier protein